MTVRLYFSRQSVKCASLTKILRQQINMLSVGDPGDFTKILLDEVISRTGSMVGVQPRLTPGTLVSAGDTPDQ